MKTIYNGIEDDEEKEDTKKIFENSPKRKILLSSLDDRDIQTIVKALEITITQRLSEKNIELLAKDSGVIRFQEWRDQAKRRSVYITMTARHPIINLIRRNLIKPLDDLKNDIQNDYDAKNIIEEEIKYYQCLIKKLKFE